MYKKGDTYKKDADAAHDKAIAQQRVNTPVPGASEQTISTTSRKRSATIVQPSRTSGQKYRFPMPDKAHARAALQDLPKANGLSSSDKAKIRSRAHRMLGTNNE